MNTMVPSDAVMPKTYFLETWNTPIIIYSIRAMAVLLLVFFIICYFCNRHK